jgi:hypothetical protein
MKKTLQDQYLLIKEGKGHKGVFLTEAKRQFPDLIPNHADVKLTAQILKDKNIINENIIGLQSINQMIPTKKESFETAFETFLKEAKKKEETDKAEAKIVSKSVEDKQEHAHDNTDEKNIDNVIFDQVMTGYYAEMKDPKNADKTMEELKAIVLKNLAKDPIHYTKEGQFGIKGLGYTDEFPGLGKTKEVKGKYASSGMEPVKLNENKQTKDMSINESISPQVEKLSNKVMSWYENHPNPKMSERINSVERDLEKLISFTTGKNKWTLDKFQSTLQQKFPLPFNDPEYSKFKQSMSTNESKLRTIIRSIIAEEVSKMPLNENVHKRLKEIDTEVQDEVTQSKLNKIMQEIEKRKAQLTMIDENEDLRELTDKSKIKALQKEIKLLEKAQAKLEKAGKGKKKEVLDEADEPSQEYLDAQQDAKDRHDNGEDIDSIMADYPQFQPMLSNDIQSWIEGTDND